MRCTLNAVAGRELRYGEIQPAERKKTVVIVGAGLAGLACAYTLGESGLDVLVVERGNYPGAKNVTGGRLYLNPVRPYFPSGFWDEAPLERRVVKERLTMVAESASTNVELQSEALRASPTHSATVLRGLLDRWLWPVQRRWR